jgi:hypothetical protein
MKGIFHDDIEISLEEELGLHSFAIDRITSYCKKVNQQPFVCRLVS